MNKYPTVRTIIMFVTVLSVVLFITSSDLNGNSKIAYENIVEIDSNYFDNLKSKPVKELITEEVMSEEEATKSTPVEIEVKKPEVKEEEKKVYEGMTLEELGEKLERSLNSTLVGQGKSLATLSINYGVDPYLALAIILHETGCKWSCSSLVRNCNNVGGMKGSPGCNGGSYASFPTLADGIESFMSNLSRNYIQKGLVTPEQINTKYAASTTWASKIHYYINEIRAK